jgi:hypothetical protein
MTGKDTEMKMGIRALLLDDLLQSGSYMTTRSLHLVPCLGRKWRIDMFPIPSQQTGDLVVLKLPWLVADLRSAFIILGTTF